MTARHTMRIHLRTRPFKISEPLRSHVSRKVRLFLGRFADRISKVTVRLDRDEAGSTSCRIDVGLAGGPVRAEDSDTEIFVAVERTAELAARRTERAIEREQAAS